MSTIAHIHSGERRIVEAFGAARAAGRAAFVPFVMGGFPTLETSQALAHACIAGGADIVELGIPCADPSADGPVIRAAASAALRAGATVDRVLDVARAIAPRVPVVVMCYAQVVRARGARRLAHDLRAAGVSGLIVADLARRERPGTLAACDAAGVALVPVVAPMTPAGHEQEIAGRARGFVYAAAVAGPTGERLTLSPRADELVARARAYSALPVALGFGIATPAQAAQAAAAGADGVIVGSRLVRTATEAADPVAAVRALTAEFTAALRGVRSPRIGEWGAVAHAA